MIPRFYASFIEMKTKVKNTHIHLSNEDRADHLTNRCLTTDVKDRGFYLKGWRGECSLDISAISDHTVEMLHHEDGLDIDFILDSKPLHNTFYFSIYSNNLDFFYQPELTPEEISEGCIRPENIVGSYAVYHKTKQGNYKHPDGKEVNYGTGKFCHILRPYAEDAKGQRTWCHLNIEGTCLTVKVPQEFLDKASYPVRIDPIFESKVYGGTSSGTGDNRYHYSHQKTMTADTGATAKAIVLWCYVTSGTTSLYTALYDDDGADHTNNLKSSYIAASTVTTTIQQVSNAINDYSLSANTKYWLAFREGAQIQYYYDTTAPLNIREYKLLTAGAEFTDPWGTNTGTISTRRWSIYCTYSLTDTVTILSDAKVATGVVTETSTINSDSQVYAADTSTIYSNSCILATESVSISLNSHVQTIESTTISSNSEINVQLTRYDGLWFANDVDGSFILTNNQNFLIDDNLNFAQYPEQTSQKRSIGLFLGYLQKVKKFIIYDDGSTGAGVLEDAYGSNYNSIQVLTSNTNTSGSWTPVVTFSSLIRTGGGGTPGIIEIDLPVATNGVYWKLWEIYGPLCTKNSGLTSLDYSELYAYGEDTTGGRAELYSNAEITRVDIYSDSWILGTETVNVSSDSWIYKTEIVNIGSDGDIQNVETITINSDGHIYKTDTITTSSDSDILATETITINSGSNVAATEVVTINSNSDISGVVTINSDSHICTTETININSDSNICFIETVVISSDGCIRGVETSVINSNSHIQGTETINIYSNSYIQVTETLTINSNSHIQVTETIDINSDSAIYETLLVDLFSDSHILGHVEIYSNTVIAEVPALIYSDSVIYETVSANIFLNSYVLGYIEIFSNSYIYTLDSTNIDSLAYVSEQLEAVDALFIDNDDGQEVLFGGYSLLIDGTLTNYYPPLPVGTWYKAYGLDFGMTTPVRKLIIWDTGGAGPGIGVGNTRNAVKVFVSDTNTRNSWKSVATLSSTNPVPRTGGYPSLGKIEILVTGTARYWKIWEYKDELADSSSDFVWAILKTSELQAWGYAPDRYTEIYSDARINLYEDTITILSDVCVSGRADINSNSHIYVTETIDINSNAAACEVLTVNILSDSNISGVSLIYSDSYIYTTETININSNGIVYITEIININSNSNIYKVETVNINSNSHIYTIETVNINSDSDILAAETIIIYSNSNVVSGVVPINSNCHIYVTETININSNAWIKLTEAIIYSAATIIDPIEKHKRIPVRVQPNQKTSTLNSAYGKRYGFKIF